MTVNLRVLAARIIHTLDGAAESRNRSPDMRRIKDRYSELKDQGMSFSEAAFQARAEWVEFQLESLANDMKEGV